MRSNFLSVFLFAFISGCSTQPFVVQNAEEFTGTGSNGVYVVSHDWHTGFVVPAAAIQQKIPKLRDRFGATPYIEVGWGDKGFYQAKEITSGLTLRSIFWPTESVMHAVSVPHKADEYFTGSEVEMLCLNDDELSLLLTFISNSFERDADGSVIALKGGLYGDSQFYKGVGDYFLMNTCNKWTAKGLKSMGMDICPTFKLTASSVIGYVQNINLALLKKSIQQPTNRIHNEGVCN